MPENIFVLGLCTVLMIYVLDPVFTGLVGLIPKLWGEIILWILFGLLIVDFIGTVIAVWGLKKKNGRIDQIREGLGRTSKLLENTMTRRLQARVIKAYPNLEKDEKEDVFASGCGFYNWPACSLSERFSEILQRPFSVVFPWEDG